MLKKLRISLLFLILGFVVIFTISTDKKISSKLSSLPGLITEESEEKFAVGEEIIYDVKLGHMQLGTSKFSRVENSSHQDKNLYVMLFETKLATFFDKEKIFTDPQTFLPIIIERDIKNLFLREKILETYDQKSFVLNIIKNESSKNLITIKSTEPIQNAILLPQQVRRLPDLKPGLIFNVNLPNRRYEITLDSIVDVDTPAGRFNAYHFISKPKQIEIWISTDERRIPVKVQSTATFGYFLILKEYKAAPKK